MVSAIDMLMELYNMRVHINTNLKICGGGKKKNKTNATSCGGFCLMQVYYTLFSCPTRRHSTRDLLLLPIRIKNLDVVKSNGEMGKTNKSTKHLFQPFLRV